MKFDKGIMLQKISSRKFWSLLAGLIGSILLVLNFDAGSIEQILGIVAGFGSIFTYLVAESLVDFGRELNKSEVVIIENVVDKEEVDSVE